MIDIYELLKSGKSMDDVMQILTDETNAAQNKIREEKEKAAAEKTLKQQKEDARKAAVATAMSYYALVYPEFSTENLELFAKTAIDSVCKSVEWTKKLEKGDYISLLDIL